MSIAMGVGKSIAAVVGVLAIGAGGYSMLSGNCLLGACGLGDKSETQMVAASGSTDSCSDKSSCCPLGDDAGEVTLVSADMTDAGACSEASSCSDAASACSAEKIAACYEAGKDCATECAEKAGIQLVSMETTDAAEGACSEAKSCDAASACSAEKTDCADKADCDTPCGEAVAKDPEAIVVNEITEG